MEMEMERRRFPRVDCTGSAQLRAWADEEPCTARVLDLSAEGCRVSLDMPQQFDLDTIVEVMFEVDRVPFLVMARVRSVRSESVLGMHFPVLSPRVRRRLAGLIEDLTERRRAGVKRKALHADGFLPPVMH